MSSFVTKIPVDVEAIKSLLPIDSYVESVSWNEKTKEVELVWSNRWFKTPFSFHEDFTVEMLKAKEQPKSVTVVGSLKSEPAPAPKPLDQKPKRGVKKAQ